MILVFKLANLVLALSSKGPSCLENPFENCGLQFKVALALELVQTNKRGILVGGGRGGGAQNNVTMHKKIVNATFTTSKVDKKMSP